MFPVLSAAFLFGSVLSAARGGGEDDDWPRWRGPRFDDSSAAEDVFDGPFSLRVRWRTSVGSGYSGVSVLGAYAVTMAASEGSDVVVALDADTGAERWRHRLGPAFPGQDGACDGPVSTPTLTADSVYALGPRGELVALALADGKPRWRVELAERFAAPRPHWGFTAAPLVVGSGLGGDSGELVVLALGAPEGRAFVALRASDGSLAWAAGSDLVGYQSPMLATLGEREVVLATGNTALFALEPSSGEVLLRAPHGGADFYQQVVQPLALGDGAFLLKNQRLSSRCVRLDPGATPPLEDLWATRHVNQNYNMAVAHDGLVFGHGGSFLACVDAFSGELLWRSRPPGNGWIVLADGHLVVLTKEGALSVAPASPDGYEERARLELFERACWTPPGFAKGRVYARDSFLDVACVDVARGEGAEPVAERAPLRGLLAELEREVAESADDAAAVDAFLARHPSAPIVEGERTAHFVWRGEADAIVLAGDMLGDEAELPLARLPGTDLFCASLELEPDARVGYHFERDAGETRGEVLDDPRNPLVIDSLRLAAPVSGLVMPRAEPPAENRLESPAVTARVEELALDFPLVRREGQTFGGPRRVWVLPPPGYAQGERRYPVLYVNDGEGARALLALPAALDALAAEGRAVIAVLVENQDAYEFARWSQELYRDALADVVVPAVDARWRTVPSPESRLVLGLDEGGYAAAFAALSRPDRFGGVAAVSLYHGSVQGPSVLARLVREADELPAVVLDWGRYDSRQPSLAIDTPRACRELADALRARGARVVAQEHSDGDEPTFWRARLPAVLRALLPAGG